MAASLALLQRVESVGVASATTVFKRLTGEFGPVKVIADLRICTRSLVKCKQANLFLKIKHGS